MVLVTVNEIKYLEDNSVRLKFNYFNLTRRTILSEKAIVLLTKNRTKEIKEGTRMNVLRKIKRNRNDATKKVELFKVTEIF